jgi:hypothetical protein
MLPEPLENRRHVRASLGGSPSVDALKLDSLKEDKCTAPSNVSKPLPQALLKSYIPSQGFLQ